MKTREQFLTICRADRDNYKKSRDHYMLKYKEAKRELQVTKRRYEMAMEKLKLYAGSEEHTELKCQYDANNQLLQVMIKAMGDVNRIYGHNDILKQHAIKTS